MKAYVYEAGTPEALALIRRVRPPIPLTHLQGIEIRNALRLKCGRNEITEAEMKAALRLFQGDIDAGRLEKASYELAGLLGPSYGLDLFPRLTSRGPIEAFEGRVHR